MALGWRCFSKGADTNYGLLLFAECFLQRVGVTWRKDRSWLTDQLVIRSRLQEGYVGCGATGSTHLIVSLRRLKGDWVECSTSALDTLMGGSGAVLVAECRQVG